MITALPRPLVLACACGLFTLLVVVDRWHQASTATVPSAAQLERLHA